MQNWEINVFCSKVFEIVTLRKQFLSGAVYSVEVYRALNSRGVALIKTSGRQSPMLLLFWTTTPETCLFVSLNHTPWGLDSLWKCVIACYSTCSLVKKTPTTADLLASASDGHFSRWSPLGTLRSSEEGAGSQRGGRTPRPADQWPGREPLNQSFGSWRGVGVEVSFRGPLSSWSHAAMDIAAAPPCSYFILGFYLMICDSPTRVICDSRCNNVGRVTFANMEAWLLSSAQEQTKNIRITSNNLYGMHFRACWGSDLVLLGGECHIKIPGLFTQWLLKQWLRCGTE